MYFDSLHNNWHDKDFQWTFLKETLSHMLSWSHSNEYTQTYTLEEKTKQSMFLLSRNGTHFLKITSKVKIKQFSKSKFDSTITYVKNYFSASFFLNFFFFASINLKANYNRPKDHPHLKTFYRVKGCKHTKKCCYNNSILWNQFNT